MTFPGHPQPTALQQVVQELGHSLNYALPHQSLGAVASRRNFNNPLPRHHHRREALVEVPQRVHAMCAYVFAAQNTLFEPMLPVAKHANIKLWAVGKHL